MVESREKGTQEPAEGAVRVVGYSPGGAGEPRSSGKPWWRRWLGG
jgi:hypothetical protein